MKTILLSTLLGLSVIVNGILGFGLVRASSENLRLLSVSQKSQAIAEKAIAKSEEYEAMKRAENARIRARLSK